MYFLLILHAHAIASLRYTCAPSNYHKAETLYSYEVLSNTKSTIFHIARSFSMSLLIEKFDLRFQICD